MNSLDLRIIKGIMCFCLVTFTEKKRIYSEWISGKKARVCFNIRLFPLDGKHRSVQNKLDKEGSHCSFHVHFLSKLVMSIVEYRESINYLLGPIPPPPPIFS